MSHYSHSQLLHRISVTGTEIKGFIASNTTVKSHNHICTTDSIVGSSNLMKLPRLELRWPGINSSLSNIIYIYILYQRNITLEVLPTVRMS